MADDIQVEVTRDRGLTIRIWGSWGNCPMHFPIWLGRELVDKLEKVVAEYEAEQRALTQEYGALCPPPLLTAAGQIFRLG